MPTTLPLPDRRHRELTRRIGLLCQFTRVAGVVYALWVIVLALSFWVDAEAITRTYGLWLKVDVAGFAPWQHGAALVVAMVPVVLLVLAVAAVWRLFTQFRHGDIFTGAAARQLRLIGVYGLAAQLTDIAARPATSVLLSLHLPPGVRAVGIASMPADLLNVLLMLGLMALAQVFSVAAEIADENAGIV